MKRQVYICHGCCLRCQVTWLEENKEMFQSLPNNPPILQYSQNEQNDIIVGLENCSTLTKEGKANPIDEYEYLYK